MKFLKRYSRHQLVPAALILTGLLAVSIWVGVVKADNPATPTSQPVAARPVKAATGQPSGVAATSTTATTPTGTAPGSSIPAPRSAVTTTTTPASTATAPTPQSSPAASFQIAITHMGQVAPGTVISYNAAKGERSYYGGDLQLSTTAMTYSRSGATSYSRDIIVTIPDGSITNMPTQPWDYRSSFGTAMDAGQYKAQGSTFPMLLITTGQPATGTYSLPIIASHSNPSGETVWYYGFVTINVVD